LNFFGVLQVQRLLRGCGNHAVGLLFKELLWDLCLGFLCVGVSLECAILGQVDLDILNVEAIGIMDSGVVFNDCGDLAAILLDEVGGPVSNRTEALNDEGLVLDAER
jgi:hypothetical protein